MNNYIVRPTYKTQILMQSTNISMGKPWNHNTIPLVSVRAINEKVAIYNAVQELIDKTELSTVFGPKDFEAIKILESDEDVCILPVDSLR
jgi:hypothetical protein